ncbi:MAG: pyridoxal phosphate-dependent aminotransferase family protein [bacterium]|nr:pyridoxal phosphate-dependent aminotransferase family protein [bacterium]
MFTKRYEQELKIQKDLGLYRAPAVIEERSGRYIYINKSRQLNFASNDYLGLASSRKLGKKAARNFKKYGTSSSSSRLVSGNFSLINRAEQEYARYFGYEDALFFPSGYQANVALVSTLFNAEDTIFFDKHIHASTVTGMVLSGASVHGFKHNSMSHLRKRLEKAAPGINAAPVITESLFSMDGDLLDISGLESLKRDHSLLTIVDEAHSFGALGKGGRGIAGNTADIAVGTMGKALGFFGAFLLLPATLKEYFINFSSPLIYSTTLPEAHAATALDILEMLPGLDTERNHLRDLCTNIKERLIGEGVEVSGDAHIISIPMGDEKKALAISEALLRKGIYLLPARYPTVPRGKAILRLSATALHQEKDVTLFVETLIKLLN